MTTMLAVLLMGQGMCMAPPPSKEITSFPSGTIIPRVGSSSLEVTTTSERARELVKQGLALRHCFWFNESLRAFRDAAKADPNCALAWWGVHAALKNPWYDLPGGDKEADYAIKRATQLADRVTPVESGLILAYRGYAETKDRRKFYEALEAVIKAHPEQTEPRLLLAGHMIQVNLGAYDESGKPFGELTRPLELANQVLKVEPTNGGAHHYVIHAIEGSSTPERALKSADAIGKCAPGSAHMVHMAGHIFFRVGHYARAREVFQRSIEVNEKYFADIKSDDSADWNYGHNVRFALFNLIEMGKFEEAKELAKKVSDSSVTTLIAERTGDFTRLDPNRFDTSEPDAVAVLFHLSQNNLLKARTALDSLKKRVPKQPKANTWSLVQSVITLSAESAVLAAEGKHGEAKKSLDEAIALHSQIAYDEPPFVTTPPEEILGHVLLRAGQIKEAVQAFEAALKWRPNSGYALRGIAMALKTKAAYQRFLDAWKDADANHPWVVEAKRLAASSN
ncbi:MAG TPA: hypothetical protein PKA27_09915 [Fimbriimonadaceae bacterium]|nr:hypothetical protein [Fimbriimonadaceae bacterium]